MKQCMEALEMANRNYRDRAQLKREIRAGERSAPDVLADLPECFRTMHPEQLMRSIYEFPTKLYAERFLRNIPVSPTRTLGEMTERQRARLAEMIEGWEERKGRRAA